MPAKTKARTIGELRQIRYKVLPVREELRKNLITRLRKRQPLFPGIVGFEDTVIPQLENALLAGQDIVLLGSAARPSPASYASWSACWTTRCP